MRLRDFLEPDLFRGVVPLQPQQAVEMIALADVAALNCAANLNLAEALTFSGNVNFVARRGARDGNMLRTATLINLHNSRDRGSVDLQLQLSAYELHIALFEADV